MDGWVDGSGRVAALTLRMVDGWILRYPGLGRRVSDGRAKAKARYCDGTDGYGRRDR